MIHPNTTDLWVVLEGSGTLTTGGIVENGKFVGGESHPLKVGDVAYLPAGLPHGVSGVNGNITWLNVRWDTDWPADSQPGAGNFQDLDAAVHEGALSVARAWRAPAAARGEACSSGGDRPRWRFPGSARVRRERRDFHSEGTPRRLHEGHGAQERRHAADD